MTAVLSNSGWSYCIKCRFVVVGSALWASRLCLPDTHWWLNGCVWVQDDDLAWRRRRAGQRWRADIRAGWFDGDKKDTQSLGPQTSCHWHGLGRADKMWVTPAQMHNIPEPKSPWTLQFQSPFTINTHKGTAQCIFFFKTSPQIQRCFQLEAVSLCARCQSLMHEELLWHFMAIIICFFLFVPIQGKSSHSGLNWAPGTWTMRRKWKHSFEAKSGKRIWKMNPPFSQCLVWRRESRRTAGLRLVIFFFFSYLHWCDAAVSRSQQIVFWWLLSIVFAARQRKDRIAAEKNALVSFEPSPAEQKAGNTSSHLIQIHQPWVRAPTLSQHLIPIVEGNAGVK